MADRRKRWRDREREREQTPDCELVRDSNSSRMALPSGVLATVGTIVIGKPKSGNKLICLVYTGRR